MKLKKCVIKTAKYRLLVLSVCKTQLLILQMIFLGKVLDKKTIRIEFWLIPSSLGQWNEQLEYNKFAFISEIQAKVWTPGPPAHMCIFLLILSIKNAAFLMIHLDSYPLEKDPGSSKEIKMTEHLTSPTDIQAPLQYKKPPL